MEITKLTVCRYENDNGMCDTLPLKLRRYALEELYQIYKEYQDTYKLVNSRVNNAEEELSAYVRSRTFEQLKVSADELNKLRERCEKNHDDKCLYMTALDGIRGAIHYYRALAVEKALEEVLPKYAGKQAGPKTREKFFREVAQFLPNKPSIYCTYFSSIEVYDSATCVVSKVYTSGELATRDNQFNPDFALLLPSDSFSGAYPADWLAWATHVQAANNSIRERFGEFVSYVRNLNQALTIGDSKMLTISEFDLKER